MKKDTFCLRCHLDHVVGWRIFKGKKKVHQKIKRNKFGLIVFVLIVILFLVVN